MTISSNLAALSVPGSATVAAGLTTASFTATAGTITSDQTATITATLNGSTVVTTISLSAPSLSSITSLSCGPNSDVAGALLCAVQLAAPAPVGGATVSLTSTSSRVQVPSTLAVPAGSQSATFTASILASDQDEQPNISASFLGAVQTASPVILGIRPTSLACAARDVQAGNWLDCEIQLSSSNIPLVARLVVSTSNPDLMLPSSITTRPNQTRLPFRAFANPLAQRRDSAVSVQFGATAVSQTISVTLSDGPILNVPQDINLKFGQPLSVTISAVDPKGLQVFLSASDLPDGATFDAGTGTLSWTPAESQQGAYSIGFTATNSASASANGRFGIVVDSGKPIITGVSNAASETAVACSPGSLASVAGRWLASTGTPVLDPSAASMELNGARVKVNDGYASLVSASASRIEFVCPSAVDPGVNLTISVENQAGASDPGSATMSPHAPGLYSLNGSGSGQGIITLAGTSLLATSRSYLALGQPAEPGDSVTIQATGIEAPNGEWPTVRIGDFAAQVQSVEAVPGSAGLFKITVVVPFGLQESDAVPVVISFPERTPLHRLPPPKEVRPFGVSNSVTMAVEPARF